jgi:uncharacterized peroxidase-related enzyme
MSRIQPVDPKAIGNAVRKNLDAVEKQLGMVPNMIRTMAISSVVLEGYLNLSGALRRGMVPAALQEQIAVTVAEANECDYCLSAHTALGRRAGVTDAELEANRDATSADPRAAAALRFAAAIVEERGAVSDQALTEIRSAGFSDAEIAELVAHVALNVFTNYFNRLAGTEIDFPRVVARRAAA